MMKYNLGFITDKQFSDLVKDEYAKVRNGVVCEMVALSLILRIPGWEVDDGVFINRRRKLFGVVVDGRCENPIRFAIGIAIGCKGGKVCVIVRNEHAKRHLGRIPKSMQTRIEILSVEGFFDLAVDGQSAYRNLGEAIEKVVEA